MTNWPNAVIFGLAVLGGIHVLRVVIGLLFCHCGKLNIVRWYQMRSQQGKTGEVNDAS